MQSMLSASKALLANEQATLAPRQQVGRVQLCVRAGVQCRRLRLHDTVAAAVLESGQERRAGASAAYCIRPCASLRNRSGRFMRRSRIRSGIAKIPCERAKIESRLHGRLHDLEIRRNIEIARREKAVMANVEDLVCAVVTPGARRRAPLHSWQDRIVHRLE